MGTRTGIPAVGRLPALLVIAILGAACGGSGTARPPSPSAPQASPSAPVSGSPSPVPATGAFGVLVSPLGGATYTVSLIGVDGSVVASAAASAPATVNCANIGAAVLPPPVSTSNSRVYFLDAAGVVHFLAANGQTGLATTVPIGAARRSMFAVSADDQRIAVVIADFTASGAATRLYVENLNGGGNHVETFRQTGAFTLWPTGWHGPSNLVVAKVPSCTQGGGPFSAGPLELHVIDPTTAARRFTIGGPNCVIAGPPSPGGAMCETNVQASRLTWTGATVRSYATEGYTPAYISPDGTHAAIMFPSGNTTIEDTPYQPVPAFQPCGWIDETHLLSGGDVQHQPRIADVSNGNIAPIAAIGNCAGRIPGGL